MLRYSLLLILLSTFVIFSGCENKELKSQFKTHRISQEELGEKVICPVCGSEITISSQTPVVKYQGQTYYFCNEEEKSQFMQGPETFLDREKTEAPDQGEKIDAVSEEEIKSSGYEIHKITPEEIDAVVLCPSCRMYLAISTKTPALEKEGKIFYFCSQNCMAEFLHGKR